MFTERPIYKLSEDVFIKFYLRQFNRDGSLGFYQSKNDKVEINIVGPGSRSWNYNVDVNEYGNGSITFKEKDIPTGYYSVNLYVYDRNGSKRFAAKTSFRKEEYRLPKFQITLTPVGSAKIDKPFKIKLLADYYAGGNLSKANVRWKINQFPHSMRFPSKVTKKYKNYLFSSDPRYTRFSRFNNSGIVTKNSTTDEYGGDILEIDPTKEANSQVRKYVVEATVTDKDNQSVTSTLDVIAYPSFVLGMNINRYYDKIAPLKPKIVAIDNKGKNIEKLRVNLKVTKREWHSYLLALPIANDKPKYRTEKVDRVIFKENFITKETAIIPTIGISEPGVYIFELEARDEIGRRYSISVDCFVNGDGAVSWEEPKKKYSFNITPEKKSYSSGDRAKIIIQSPFKNARVLVVRELPKITDYKWVNISDYKGSYSFNIKNNYAPRVPITFILMKPRGNWKEAKKFKEYSLDIEKPQTIVSTYYLPVVNKNREFKIEINHPQKVLPGQEVTFEISLKNNDRENISGEVCLWLVDRSVLSLGNETPLRNVFSKMNRNVYSKISFYDFRNLIYGRIPWYENPGGGMKNDKLYVEMNMISRKKLKENKQEQLLEDITVRKTFNTIAYYNPSIRIDETGKKKITFKMPDNLTDFAIRAIASSKKDSFAVFKSKILVRLPILIQPVLPRFVRYGDQFNGGAIARVVDGKDGKGITKMKGIGVKIGKNDSTTKEIVWQKKDTKKIFSSIKVNNYNATNQLTNITIAVLGARYYDEAKDGFQIEIPVKTAKSKQYQSYFFNVTSLTNIKLEKLKSPILENTFEQKISFTYEDSLLKMIAGLDYLLQFPHGCLEQKISKSMAAINMKRLYNQMGIKAQSTKIEDSFQEVMKTIKKNRTTDGLFSYWPGSTGYVSLTAYVLNYLTLAKKSGYQVDGILMGKIISVLKKALRSDYSLFISSAKFYERITAFDALANAGHFDSSYVDEIYNSSKFASLETRARLFTSLKKNDYFDRTILRNLEGDLWGSVNFRLRNGQEFFSGMNYGFSSWGNIINTYEKRAMAVVLRGLSQSTDSARKEKIQKVANEMIAMGDQNGWGNTLANASAIEAISEYISGQGKKGNYPEQKLRLSFEDSSKKELQVGGKSAFNTVDKNTPLLNINLQDDWEGNKFYPNLNIHVDQSYFTKGAVESIAPKQNGFLISYDITKIATEQDQRDEKIKIDKINQTNIYKVGDILEFHVEVVNPNDKNFVAVVIPLAAGFEILNPNLKTSSSLAVPSSQNTTQSTYEKYLDDQVRIYYNQLANGNHHFYFRVKATFSGNFSQPSSYVEMMYRQQKRATTHGLRVIIEE